MNRLADLLDKKRKARREVEDLDSQKNVKQARSEAKETVSEVAQVSPHQDLLEALSLAFVNTALVVLHGTQVENVVPASEKVCSLASGNLVLLLAISGPGHIMQQDCDCCTAFVLKSSTMGCRTE